MSVEDNKVLELQQRKERIRFGGGTKAIEKQKAMGKLTARERIIALVDADSFHEYDMFVEHDGRDFGMQDKSLPGDGVIIGTGTILGSPVAIFAQDFTVAGGSLGFMHARKITKIMDYALNMRIPLIGINDSGGARIQEGVNALAGYGEIFFRNTLSSGVIPQISVILGPCAGGAVYSPALTDFVFVVENISKMFITGPEVIKTVLGEEISMEELGGAKVHSEMTGNAHFYATSEDECFVQIRKLISMIPANNTTKAEKIAPARPLPEYDITKIVPADPTVPYDVRDVIKALVDESEFLVQGEWTNLAHLATDTSNWVVIDQPEKTADKVLLDYKAPVAAAIMLLMIAMMVFDFIPVAPVTAVIIAGLLTVFAGCFRNVEAAYKTINWESIVLIAAMMPMSTALEKTGASALVSQGLVESLGSMGPTALLAGIYFTTSLMTMFISNTATAVLMAPIALVAAQQVGVSPYSFLFAVTLGASMCFASPFSTPPNALVMKAGGYTFMDYVKVGLPLQVIIGVVMTFVLPLLFPY